MLMIWLTLDMFLTFVSSCFAPQVRNWGSQTFSGAVSYVKCNLNFKVRLKNVVSSETPLLLQTLTTSTSCPKCCSKATEESSVEWSVYINTENQFDKIDW